MARWRIKAKHYLKVTGSVWRYEETDRETGEQRQEVFPVPRLIDPDSPRDCRTNGDCICSYADGAQRGDWVFTGPPTPDMEPLDAEAEAITAEWQPKWVHPIDTLPAEGGFSEAIFRNLEQQLTKAFAGAANIPNSAVVSKEDFETLQQQVAALMARNAELESGGKAPRRA